MREQTDVIENHERIDAILLHRVEHTSNLRLVDGPVQQRSVQRNSQLRGFLSNRFALNPFPVRSQGKEPGVRRFWCCLHKQGKPLPPDIVSSYIRTDARDVSARPRKAW